MVEEMRLWRVVRTEEEINMGLRADDGLTKDHTYSNPGLDANHPDLVAYWKFDAGDGYNVKDATGRGHDLRMSYVPHWRVVNWLSICGNGIVEGAEECDDGNHNDGDGCSHICQVESGWFCTKERPSVCSRPSDHNQPAPAPAPAPPPYNPYNPSSQDHGRGSGGSSYDPHNYNPSDSTSPAPKKKGHGGLITFFVVTVIFGCLGTVAYFKREEIYDRFPKVRVAVENIKEKVFRKERNYDMLHLGPGDDILAPEFVGMQPGPGSYKPPTPEVTEAESQQDELS